MEGEKKMNKSELTTIFDSFYTRFVLRDLLAKIVPGATVLLTISITVTDPKCVFDYLADLRFWTWIFLTAFSWTVGIAIQGIGDKIRLIRNYPKWEVPGQREFKLETWYKKIIEFHRVASEDEKQKLERFGVIKEACGNEYVALFIPTILLFIRIVKLYDFDLAVAIIIVIIFMCSLCYMYHEHLQRHYKYLEEVLKYAEKRKGLKK